MDLAGFEPHTCRSPDNTLSFELSRPQSAIFHPNNVTTSQPVSDNKSTFYCNEW